MTSLSPVVVGMGAAAAVGAAATTLRFGLAMRRARRARRRFERRASASHASAPARARIPPAIASMLADAGIDTRPDALWRSWVLGAAGVGLAGALLGGPALGVLAIVAAVVAPFVTLLLARGRGDRQLEAALPDALDAMARNLRSGASLLQAIDEAARSPSNRRLAADLRKVAAAAVGGRPVVDALDAWGINRPLPGVRLAVAALAVAAESGGPPARAVEGVAATVRARLAVGAEIRALGSQARYSALVIGLAPVAFMALAAGTDGPTATFLFRTPLGLVCLATGLLLDAAGAFWMHRIATVRTW